MQPAYFKTTTGVPYCSVVCSRISGVAKKSGENCPTFYGQVKLDRMRCFNSFETFRFLIFSTEHFLMGISAGFRPILSPVHRFFVRIYYGYLHGCIFCKNFWNESLCTLMNFITWIEIQIWFTYDNLWPLKWKLWLIMKSVNVILL